MEVEIKLPVSDLQSILSTIRSIGFAETGPRSLETNILFDDAAGSLMDSRRLLRLREYSGKTILTFKGPPVPGKHKQREERETTVGSAEDFRAILEGLGYEPTFRYEKFRTVFRREYEAGELVVDETPAGPFLELEGDPEWIDRVAAELGYAPNDYLTVSYATIACEYFERLGLPFADFVFANATGEKRD